MRRNRRGNIIGIDEAGRGPLAGPIVIAGVKMSSYLARSFLRGIRDSKKLNAKTREEWYLRLTVHPRIQWIAVSVSHTVIDRVNITRAGLRGVRRAYRALAPEGSCRAFLDGGLALPDGIRQKTIIKGDEKVPLIAAASIIAKVTRDRMMMRAHRTYPQYRFDLHKGYGTRLHREMIRQFGVCQIHRRSFRWA